MNNTIVKHSYIVSTLSSIAGAMMKIYQMPYANILLCIGICALLIFMVSAIIEVNKSSKISFGEKFMWGLGFIFFSTVAGLIYLTSARKRIV